MESSLGSLKPFPLQEEIIYGPLPSRRLGLSLGVNLLPFRSKLCSFDCRYCQLGWTPRPTMELGEQIADLPSPGTVSKALEEHLRRLSQEGVQLDVITFSGNGEPTLHPSLGQIAEVALDLRDRYCPWVKLAILSNSSTVGRREVREALEKFDLKIMKLDAGDEETIRRLNRPTSPFDLGAIIEGLRALRRVTLQSLFVQGRVSNVEPSVLDAWIARIVEVQPTLVQVYSLDRIPADRGLRKVERPVLERIARLVEERTGIRAEVY